MMFSAWFGGFSAGLLALGLSVLALDYYFLPPIHQLWTYVDEVPGLVLFALGGLGLAVLSAAWVVSRLVAESLTQALRICRGLAKDDDDVALVFAQLGERRVTISKEGTTAYLKVAFHAPEVKHRDFLPLLVLDAVLSGAKGVNLGASFRTAPLASAIPAKVTS